MIKTSSHTLLAPACGSGLQPGIVDSKVDQEFADTRILRWIVCSTRTSSLCPGKGQPLQLDKESYRLAVCCFRRGGTGGNGACEHKHGLMGFGARPFVFGVAFTQQQQQRQRSLCGGRGVLAALWLPPGSRDGRGGRHVGP